VYGLGDLEAAVMHVLWRCAEPVKVRDVLGQLDTGRELAYTTVHTVLDNLRRKGWVQRRKIGKAYVYGPVPSQVEAGVRTLRAFLDESGDPEGVLLNFARSASEHESRLLWKGITERRAD
jgi:predicted transcriptional regulator